MRGSGEIHPSPFGEGSLGHSVRQRPNRNRRETRRRLPFERSEQPARTDGTFLRPSPIVDQLAKRAGSLVCCGAVAAERGGLANRGGHPCLAHEVPSYRKLRSPERHRANICACFIHTDISDKIDQAQIGSPKRRRTWKLARSRVMSFSSATKAASTKRICGRTSRASHGHDGIQPGQDLARGHDATQSSTAAK